MTQGYYEDSIVWPNCRHFRLRVDEQIVGYMQIRPSKKVYYSKDNFWWTRNKIHHIHKDRSTEAFDANRTMIFEHDVVKIKKSDLMTMPLQGWIIWRQADEQLLIQLLDKNATLKMGVPSPDAPFRNDLKVIGQMYPG